MFFFHVGEVTFIGPCPEFKCSTMHIISIMIVLKLYGTGLYSSNNHGHQ